MGPEYRLIATALRNKAAEVRNVNVESAKDYQVLRDVSDLLRVLAKIMEGEPVIKAFGAPGDWGYETSIGQAVYALREVTCARSEGGV